MIITVLNQSDFPPPQDWEQRYLHENYSRNADPDTDVDQVVDDSLKCHFLLCVNHSQLVNITQCLVYIYPSQ